ncbi:MAG: cytosine permease, partial [Hyphomonadaceae bacterium]|nr:cytosine permease [Hyphomonadaceae bacterium]
AIAFSVGSLILGVMGAITSYVGARTRFSTYLLTEFSFGTEGAKIANLAVALSLIGWFGVISNTLGQATQQMIFEAFGHPVSPYLTVSVASFLMVTVTALGFSGIDKLALYLVPLMAAFIVFAAFLALSRGGVSVHHVDTVFTYQTAISAVVGSYISGVIIQPDYSRFAINTRHAIWSVLIALGVIFPLVQFFSAIPGMATGQPDVVLVMAALGIAVPAFFLFFLGAWSSNVLCLYSSGLSIATILERFRLQHIIIAIGIIGTAIAFIPAQDYLINYLVLLGVTIPPIGAIYIIDAFFVRRFKMSIEGIEKASPFRISAFAAWGGAAIAGYISSSGGIGLTTIASLDSLIAASLIYAALNWPTISRNSRELKK